MGEARMFSYTLRGSQRSGGCLVSTESLGFEPWGSAGLASPLLGYPRMEGYPRMSLFSATESRARTRDGEIWPQGRGPSLWIGDRDPQTLGGRGETG